MQVEYGLYQLIMNRTQWLENSFYGGMLMIIVLPLETLRTAYLCQNILEIIGTTVVCSDSVCTNTVAAKQPLVLAYTKDCPTNLPS
jgi:hypothetical protein